MPDATLLAGVLAAAAALVVMAAPPASGQASPELSRPVAAALAGSAPGTYLVNGSRIGPAGDAVTPSSVFLQADAYRRTPAGVQVTVLVGMDVPQPWTARVLVARAAEGTSAGPVREVEATLAGGAGRVRETRDFALAPGVYDITAAVAHAGSGGQLVATVARRRLVVPDQAAGTLSASPVVLGEAASPLPADGQDRAFRFGGTSLTPATLNRFRQSDDLYVAFRLSGWKGDDEARPDVTVEYVFRQVLNGRPRFFNKVKPQELNAASLDKAFDGRPGLLATGMAIPLAAFPPGEFELDVRAHDRRTHAGVEQTVRFFVAPS